VLWLVLPNNIRPQTWRGCVEKTSSRYRQALDEAFGGGSHFDISDDSR